MSHRERPRWFPLDRLSELESAISAQVAEPRTRRYGIAAALGLHGLRVGEVARARAAHFQPDLGTLYVATIKGGIPRTVRLHRTVVESIIAHRAETGCDNSAWLLPNRNGRQCKEQSLSSAGQRLLRACGVTFRPRFHMLRHTFAMRLLAETNDIMLVKQQLGHSSIQTTMVYAESLKTVPESCLVVLSRTPATITPQDPQLKLFEPIDYPREATG